MPADKALMKHFENLEGIKNFLEARLQTIEHPRVVILSFEESEIFPEYSILVKVMNNSIFSTIKNNRNKNIFLEICRLEGQLAKAKDAHKNYF